ncbi:MAG: aldehyde ferredoxin oxidoreductase family protein [Desulfosarcinaceae bacterium]|nr:aldehyde ferredoxin oxidoreductase family protein [Desulfosarcinaceae bacterium]
MLPGYAGTILRIDLTQDKIAKQPLPAEMAHSFIGGRGFVAKTLFDELPPQADPLGPENLFIAASGPMSGHFMPASGKTHFGCKSPATGGYGDSNLGGHFGPSLKYAGYDMLILTGRAPQASLLVIEDERIALKPAGDLWGMGSIATEARLKAELGDAYQILTIGPAGENGVVYACITHDFGRQAGRVGIGAVLGSKNIKAIAVKGTGSIPVADPKAALTEGLNAFQAIRTKPGFTGWTPEGTAGITDWINRVGAFPTRNFQTSYWDQHTQINGAAILRELKITDKGCYCCPTPCGKYGKARTGLGDVYVEGPEFETISLLGSNCLIGEISEIAYANYVCDELGLDTISAGVVCSWAIECYEKGLLDRETIGRDVQFGDLASVVHLLECISRREGIGDLLAHGVKTAAQKVGQGSEAFAIHVKGLEWSGYECRNAPGMMLAYMTSDIGAHHARAWVLGHDLAGSSGSVHDLIASKGKRERLPKSEVTGRAANVIASQHLRPLFDLLGICRLQFMELGFEVEHYERLFAVITGNPLSWDDMLAVSEKVWHLTRSISARELQGFGRAWDYPPERFMAEPIPDGPNEGHCISRAEIDILLDEYYDLRGWDRNGLPTAATLERCGLKAVARTMATWACHGDG